MGRAFETKLNILLSEILNEKLKLQSDAETRRGSGRRPDILIDISGVKIVIEASYSRNDAEADVNKKIEEGYGDIGVALYYKEPISDAASEPEIKNILTNSKFEIKIIAKQDLSELNKKRSIPLTEWSEVDIGELSSILINIKDFLVNETYTTEAINEIEIKTNDFVERMKTLDKDKFMAQKLYDVFYKLQGLYYGDYKEIAELVYAQSFLALLLSTMFYNSIQSTKGLDSLNKLKSNLGIKGALQKAYEEIQNKVDYKPIFILAQEVIENIPSELLDVIFELSMKYSNTSLLKKDFSGKLYHKIVGDWQTRKGFATYFTTIPASYLLSYLTVFSEFSPVSNVEELSVCDFTCGSGTLLNAIYAALKDKYILENFEKGEVDLEKFHKNLLENNLWGFDALRYAVQIASLNLVFQNPNVPLETMNLHTIPLGLDKNGEIVLGSLKFLYNDTLFPYFDDYLGEEVSILEKHRQKPALPKFDLIIMNPPFTRATGRHGKKGELFGFIADKEIRAEVKKEYKKARDYVKKALLKTADKYFKIIEGDRQTYSGIGPAGEGLLFMYLASQHLKDGGRIAFVLPKSILSGVSWFLMRAYLLERFHIEYIVVSYDKRKQDEGGGYNFSESTNLSEVLIVAQKKKENDSKTKFIALLKKPDTSFEAKRLAKLIIKSQSSTDLSPFYGVMQIVSKSELEENIDNWIRFVAFPSQQLNDFVRYSAKGIIAGHKFETVKLQKLAQIGIDRHQFRDYFKETNLSDGYPAVIGGEEENRSRLIVKPNAKIIAKNAEGTELFKQMSSNLLIPDRIWITTVHYLALYSEEPVMSNLFYSVKFIKETDEQKYKALCLWLNSVWGMLTILSNREETEGGWIRLKEAHWRALPVLDVSKLDNRTLAELSKIFDKHSKNRLNRLTAQFDPKNLDQARKTLDLDFAEAIGIKITEEELIELYRIIHAAFSAWL
ncbi:MAG: hypothetical protein RXR31_06305 [Thermoproteota archaeon]